jgi:hypothetical protein
MIYLLYTMNYNKMQVDIDNYFNFFVKALGGISGIMRYVYRMFHVDRNFTFLMARSALHTSCVSARDRSGILLPS